MKNLKIKTGILTLGLLLSAVSCEQYLDINDNPNQVAIELVTPNELLPVGITKTYSTQGRTLMQFSSVVMNSLAGNSLSYGAPYIDDYKPNVSNTFYNTIWDGLYLGTANFEQIIKYNDPEGKYAQYKAIAKIMKANYIQILTDLYGDMPYSEAFQQQGNLTPKYDKGENIYRASITDLEDAIAIIDSHVGDAPTTADIVFQGNMTNWKAFANTLKLRYLLRMSNIPSGDLATFRDQKLATLSSATFINQNVLENPGYSAANDSQQNPFTGSFVLTTALSRPQNYSYNVASENIQIILNGNSEADTRSVYQKFTGVVDGRRARMFNLVGGKVVGIRQGNLPGDAGVPTGGTLSRFNYGITITGTSTPTSNAQLLAMTSSKSGCIMSLAESKFLQAEAALRYPSLFPTVNAQANFTAGITASFTFFGSNTGTLLSTYLGAITTKTGLGWIGSDTNKIEAIMTQKWIALTGVNPEQSYFDYTRTGFPVTLSATIATNPKPNRLIYPLSEYIANSGNVPAISNTDVFSKNQYTPFWGRN
jgi:hypothetical protein